MSALSLVSGGGLDASGDMMKFLGPLDRGSGESGMKKRVGRSSSGGRSGLTWAVIISYTCIC